MCAALYCVAAVLEGRSFLVLYLGVLVVVFLLHASNEQRSRRQMDLLVQLVRELDRKQA